MKAQAPAPPPNGCGFPKVGAAPSADPVSEEPMSTEKEPAEEAGAPKGAPKGVDVAAPPPKGLAAAGAVAPKAPGSEGERGGLIRHRPWALARTPEPRALPTFPHGQR